MAARPGAAALVFLLPVLLLGVASGAGLSAGEAAGRKAEGDRPGGGSWRVRDGESLRWEGIHRQETSRSCGPAALVTLLRYYLGIPITEEEAARRALGLGKGDVSPDALLAPTTMRGLRDALATWGLAAYGLRASLAQVRAYVDQVGLPLIARIAHPEPHFTLIAGVARGHVLLADPALGWRAVPEGDFVAMWDGVVLALDPRAAADAPAGRDHAGARGALVQRADHLRWGVARR